MNLKIDKLIDEQGWCCKWGFFKAHEHVGTSRVHEHLGGPEVCSIRALQQQRERFRDEQFHCKNGPGCFKVRPVRR